MKKLVAIVTAAAMALSLAACSGGNASSAGSQSGSTASGTSSTAPGSSDKKVVINVGYENATTEPAAKAAEKWKSLVEEKSNGTIDLELFPNSTLGKKNDLIDQMVMGENIITVADGAFLADYGVPDFGIFYAPFMFKSWDDEWTVVKSDWYKGLCDKLAQKGGLRVLSSNWIYGARNIMSIKPVKTPADLAGLKMRVSSNDLSITSFNDLGASAVGMDMSDVYQALQAGTIDAVENPISSLTNRSFQEVAKYLIKDEHILAVSMWICGESFYSTLTPEQQQILSECADEAGLYNNDLYDQATADATKKLQDAGVQIRELSDSEKQTWNEAGQKFYKNDTGKLGWSDNLYNKVDSIIKGK